MKMIRCKCGCSTRVPCVDARGRRRSGYVSGHNRRGKSNYWLITKRPRWPARHGRAWSAKKLRAQTRCALRRIGSCKGPLEVHHRNENPLDRRSNNLLKICRAHHFLIHIGRIDLRRPKMPLFYVRGNGKRVYLPKLTEKYPGQNKVLLKRFAR